MIEVRRTAEFTRWLHTLRDRSARSRVELRLLRVASGHLGDTRAVGDGVSELRIDYGPGYRLYCLRRGETLIVLLCGGDKSTQDRDILRAKRIAADWDARP